MALEKEVIHTAEIDESGIVFQVTRTIIKDDGVEIANNHAREPIRPGDDFSGRVKFIRDVCAAAHTQTALDLAAAKRALNEARDAENPDEAAIASAAADVDAKLAALNAARNGKVNP